MKKKVLLVMVAILAMGQSAFAYDFSAVAPNGQTLYYNINGSNVTVTSPNSSSPYWTGSTKPTGVLIIPSSVNYNGTTYTVTCIGSHAFFSCDDITSVTIPNSVASISDYAFAYCSGLVSMTIPDSVTSIGNNAYYDCPLLTTVTLPNSLTSIGPSAFSWCIRLTSVIIPNTISSIPDGLFYNCLSLSSVTIPNSLTSIGSNAFGYCRKLTSVTIPNTVTSIGYGAFYNCSSLGSVTIPNTINNIGVDAFGQVNNILFFGTATGCPWGAKTLNGYVNNGLVYYDSSMTILTGFDGNDSSITIPNSVTHIGDYAFNYCYNLTSITIPGSVDSIGNYAFYYCNNLTEIYSLAAVPPVLSYNSTFYHVGVGIPVYVACGAVATYQTTIVWNNFTNIQEIPWPTVSIAENTNGNVDIVQATCDNHTATINAISNYGYHFTQWNDGDTNNPRTLSLTCDTTLTAFFERNTYHITMLSADEVMGYAIASDTLPLFGDSVTFTAISNYGYHFTHWNNDIGWTSNPTKQSVSGDATYIAYFDYNQYALSLNVDTFLHGSVSGAGVYNYLSENTIEATAAHGYHFSMWSDGNTDNPRTVMLTQDTSLIAYFEKNSYTVSAVSNDTVKGTAWGDITTLYLDSITISATANYGYVFSHWNDGNTDNPRTVQVTDNTTYTAYFDYDQFTLTVQSDNTAQGNVSGGGNYNYLSNHTITATPTYGHHFTYWNDGVTENPRTITLTQDTTFTAHFAPNQYTLTVNAGEHGTATGSGTYNFGDTITIQAFPDDHYHFTRWNDGNTENPRQYRIEDNITLTAFFVIDTYTVSVVSSDIIRGMVEASGTEFVYGTPCTVTATAYTGYTFAGWSNGITANPYTFAVISDVELTALFVEEGEEVYTVTVESADPTMGTVSGGGQALNGGTLTIRAIPNNGYRFLSWQDGNTENPRTVTVTGNATYTAYFESTQGIGDIDATEIKIYATGGRIVVRGAERMETRVYDLTGREVVRPNQNGETPVLPSGVYLVKVGTLPARKVVVMR